jgi:hypothetical protein
MFFTKKKKINKNKNCDIEIISSINIRNIRIIYIQNKLLIYCFSTKKIEKKF